MQNISDNIRTERVSALWCEFVYAGSGNFFVENISGNIHTDTVSPLCESVCALSGYLSVKNTADNIHTDVVSPSCELAYVHWSGKTPI